VVVRSGLWRVPGAGLAGSQSPEAGVNEAKVGSEWPHFRSGGGLGVEFGVGQAWGACVSWSAATGARYAVLGPFRTGMVLDRLGVFTSSSVASPLYVSPVVCSSGSETAESHRAGVPLVQRSSLAFPVSLQPAFGCIMTTTAARFLLPMWYEFRVGGLWLNVGCYATSSTTGWVLVVGRAVERRMFEGVAIVDGAGAVGVADED
jgi:hypothetical protein